MHLGHVSYKGTQDMRAPKGTRARGPVGHLDQEGTSGTQFSTLKSETLRNKNRERFNM